MLTPLEIEQNKQEFLTLLKSINRDGIDALANWLESDNCDFFVAPSSTRYHGNYPGGLCEHSLNVYKAALALRDNVMSLSKKYADDVATVCPDESIKLAALLHDLCKTNFYSPEVKSFKDTDGYWKKYSGYKIEDKFPYGHGDKSVFMVQRFGVMLTGQEALAIKYHMGPFDESVVLSTYLKGPYCQAMNTTPLLIIISQADAFATYCMEDALEPKDMPRLG